MPLDVLPDSRLSSARETVMADWPVEGPDGTTRTIRLELEPIFCINCGKPNGYVPVGIMSWVSFLCVPCSGTWGEAASALYSPDQEFWDAVGAEMVARFGRALTQAELERLAHRGELGRNLELLERESPYLT